MNSSIADVIIAIIRSCPDAKVSNHQHTQADIIQIETNKYFSVFSYKEDFAELWGQKDSFEWVGSLCAFDAAKHFRTIIVWDGYPAAAQSSGAVPIENWVTPIDWAVSAALSSFKKAKALASSDDGIPAALSNWGVMIIDLVSQNYPGAQSLALLRANPALMPWLRIYRPAIAAKEAELNQFDNLLIDEQQLGADRYALLRAMTKDDFISLIEDIRTPERILGLKSSYGTLEALASIWSANIVRPGDRHQVANIIAPIVLFESVRNYDTPVDTDALHKSVVNPLTSALIAQLATLQLIEMPGGGGGKRTLKVISRVKGLLAKCKTAHKIILVDDQYALGYDKILNYIMGGACQIECENAADKLFNKLRKHFCGIYTTTPGWRRSIYSEPTILFFDLRLWTNTEELEKHNSQLIEIMELYTNNIRESSKNIGIKNIVATPGNSAFKDLYTDYQREKLKEDWNSIKGYLSTTKSSENLLALTLLPRLLSCVDPFLPIILFSSSSQRETIEAFHGYPNIISCFQKPMPAGYKASLTPVDYLEDLSTAFYKAVLLCLMRPIGEGVCKLERNLYKDKKKLSVKIYQSGLPNKDIDIDSKMVCLDLRRATYTLLAGEYNYSSALPHMLIETWLNYDNKDRDRQGYIIKLANDPSSLHKERNTFAHIYADYSYDFNDWTVINYIEKKLLPTWKRFFNYIDACIS